MISHVHAPTAEASTQTKTAQPSANTPMPVGAMLVDNRPAAVAQRKLNAMMQNSPQAIQGKARADQVQNSPVMVAQRAAAAGLFGGVVQRREGGGSTGLPDGLKAGLTSLSGLSMDHVKVHYNSSQPAQLNALAYAQGSEIHLGPGQEQHLPHEAWHVVQQAQGRVRPTMQMKAGVPVNDDAGLEAEADAMGAKALGQGATQLAADLNANPNADLIAAARAAPRAAPRAGSLQRTSGQGQNNTLQGRTIQRFVPADAAEAAQVTTELDTLLGAGVDPAGARAAITANAASFAQLQAAVASIVAAAVPHADIPAFLLDFGNDIEVFDQVLQLSDQPGFGTPARRLRRVLDENPAARTVVTLTPLLTAKKQLDQKVLAGVNSLNPFTPATLAPGVNAQGNNLSLVGAHSDRILDPDEFHSIPQGAVAANGARNFTTRKTLRNDANVSATNVANDLPGNIGTLALDAANTAHAYALARPAPNVPAGLAALPAAAQAFWANRQVVHAQQTAAVNAAHAPVAGLIAVLTAAAAAVLAAPAAAERAGFVDAVRTLMQQVDNVVATARQATTTVAVNALPDVVAYHAGGQHFLTHGPAMSITKETTIPPVGWTDDQVLDAGHDAIQAPVRWVENYPLVDHQVTQTLHQAVVPSPTGGPAVVWSAVKDQVTYTTPPSAYTVGQVLGFWPTDQSALPPLPAPGVAVMNWYTAP